MHLADSTRVCLSATASSDASSFASMLDRWRMLSLNPCVVKSLFKAQLAPALMLLMTPYLKPKHRLNFRETVLIYLNISFSVLCISIRVCHVGDAEYIAWAILLYAVTAQKGMLVGAEATASGEGVVG